MGVVVREKDSGSGVWWVFVNEDGHRTSRKVGSKRLALEVAEKIKAKLVLRKCGLVAPEKVKLPLFRDYAQIWLEGFIKHTRRPATYERYRDVLKKYVTPKLGSLPLDQISRGQVRDLLLGIYSKGLSKASVCIVRDTISGVMGFAVDEELIPSNPVIGITKRLNLGRDDGNTVEPMTHEEVALFLETCAKHYPERYPFFLTAFRTGMRLGELLALQWGDIDWHGRFIVVRRSFKGGYTTSTKTGKARRVDMSNQLFETLCALQTKRKREAVGAGRGELAPLIFHKGGLPIAQNSARNHFKRILQKAGLREMRVHDIRHTFASLLLSAGQSPVYVKEQLGHSSISMTVDIYGHLIPSSNRDAVNQLDEAAPECTPRAPYETKNPVTHQDYGTISFLVPKGRLELPHPYGY
ncbi:integrase family protein [Desulfarculus baarsii DSM 2075]|uniref:Integrase family protein n=1 Tax=Desulfarculus baarsii (strain ATCC 33931 / DSM 2075 / LMG 7858 / VKM B-1802 / 2st14) TaxID=644282 RepID=E1QHP8_DESB2|nr:integrase family protein [Desulfarculus baarsii DSM 2075]